MARISILHATPSAHRTQIADKILAGRRGYLTEFHTPEDPINFSRFLLARPEVVIVDDCPVDQLESVLRIAKCRIIRVKHPVTGLREIETPDFIILVNKPLPSGLLGGDVILEREAELIDCSNLKEVFNG